jgi:RNA polymerase sigma factor (sigma-70 family)
MEALLAELSPSVRRHGRRLCRHEADAMDVLQDTLLAVASKLETLEQDAALSSWVYTLARTACGRRRRGLAHHASKVALDATAVEGELGREAMATSSPEELLEAARVGITVGALKSRLHRARAALREAFERLDPTERDLETDVWSCASDDSDR